MALTINISFKPSIEELQKKYKSVNIQGFLSNQIKKLAFEVEGESKKVTPVDTGRLRNSIITEIKPLEARIRPETNYAFFVHNGTRYLRPRPFMLWGTEKATSGLENKISGELDKFLEKKLK